MKTDLEIKSHIVDSDMPPFNAAFERQTFENGTIKYPTLFCLFSKDTMEGADCSLDEFANTLGSWAMEVYIEKYHTRNTFFVIQGRNHGQPFEFRKANLKTGEIEYSVREETCPTWQEAWIKLNEGGTIGLFEAAAVTPEAIKSRIRRAALEDVKRIVIRKGGDAIRLRALADRVGYFGKGELTVENEAFLDATINYIDREAAR